MESMITNRAALSERILVQYGLPLNGIHGPSHWARVALAGSEVCTGAADKKVVELFAMLHDSRRQTEDYCEKHGHEAAAFVRELHLDGTLSELDGVQLETLVIAIEGHTDRRFTEIQTVAACWDADRLDIWRVGILPDKEYMNTPIGKRLAGSKEAHRKSRGLFQGREQFPEQMIGLWPELYEAWKQ